MMTRIREKPSETRNPKLEIRNKFESAKCWNDKNGKLAAAVEAAN